MRKLTFSIMLLTLLSVAGLLAATGSAQAAWDWCFGDPVVDINGKRVSIDIAVPAPNLDDINGDVLIEVSVPRNVAARVVLVDSPYFTERVTIRYRSDTWQSDQSIKVEVRAKVNASEKFPVLMQITYVKKDGVTETRSQTAESNKWLQDEFGLE